jgi:flagellum-specific peptidoglycan hydrolase FlgJ
MYRKKLINILLQLSCICFELQSDGNSDETKANEAKTKTKMKTNKQNKTRQDKTRKPNLDHSSCVSQAVSCNIISEHQRLHGLLISCSEFFLLRQYFTHLISLFFLLSIVVNNQPIPQAKSNFTKQNKTRKTSHKAHRTCNLKFDKLIKDNNQKKNKKTNKQTKEQKRKRKKHARARAHTHANQNNRAKQANKTNSSSDAQKLINQAPDATTNRQVPKTKANVSAIAIGLMSF